tara:strand:- start:3409 stop:3825 length:417 start_codon:yes stop_codon:yes gene_type:complete
MGITPSKIASALKVSVKNVNQWKTGKAKPPNSLYEPIRNLARRTVYKQLRKGGFSPGTANLKRRSLSTKLPIKWLNTVANTLWKDWNFSFRAYTANPEGWIAKHPNKKIPVEISIKEVRDRIERGIERGRDREDLENY